MTKSRRFTTAFAAAAAALILLHVYAARRTPFGAASDDALHILLARNLWHGAFAVPDPSGAPATDPLPGFALLMMIPVRLLAPRWWLLRFAALGSAAALIVAVHAAARRLAGEAAAAVAALFVALNQVLVGWAGVAMPDIPYAALSALAFLEVSAENPSSWRLGALCAVAALLRPQGAVLALAVSAAVLVRRGPRAALVLAAASLAPLGGWIVRNRLAAGEATRYLTHARSLAQTGSGLAGAAEHVLNLVARMGWGLLGLPAGAWAMAAALLIAGLGALGARRLWRVGGPSRSFSIASLLYLCGLAAMHVAWRAWQSRYVLPPLPVVAVLAAAGAAPLFQRRPASAALALALLLLPNLRLDLGFAAGGAQSPRRELWPDTAAWLRAHIGPDECLTTLEPYLAVLVVDRRVCMLEPAPNRDAWLASLRARGARWILVRPSGPRGYASDSDRRLLESFDAWAVPSPPLSSAFTAPSESTAVLHLD